MPRAWAVNDRPVSVAVNASSGFASPSESLASRTRESLETIQDFLGTLVARYRSDESAHSRGIRVYLESKIPFLVIFTIDDNRRRISYLHG